MRFAWVLAAMAALWVQPVGAVTIVLQQPTPEAGFHQKISLTGVTGADTISATGFIPAVTFYYWESPSVLNGNEASDLFCTAVSGGPACHAGSTLVSSAYPVKAAASLDLNIVGNDVFIDWTMFAQDICGSIPEADRNAAPLDRCGYGWYRGKPATLNIDVTGPSAQNFNYSVSNVITAPGPVPEPASWALMILGVGMAGAVLRKHQNDTAPDGKAMPAAT